MSESRFRGFGNLCLSDDTPTEKPSKYDDPDSDRSDDYEVEPGTNSIIRQNFHELVQKPLNNLINLKLQIVYLYKSMGFHFDSCDVGLPGFSKFFMDRADKVRGRAVELGKVMNKRGGRVILFGIKKPNVRDWGTGLDAMQAALELEKDVIETLHVLHRLSVKNADPHMEKVLNDYICKQVKVIKKLGCHVITLKKLDTDLALYIFDRETLKGKLITDSDSSSSSSSSSSDSDSD